MKKNKSLIIRIFSILMLILVLFLPIIAIEFARIYFDRFIFDNPDFWYGYMSYFGTTLLAGVAIWQNKKANDTSNRLLMKEERQLVPYLDICREKCKIYEIKNSAKLKVKLFIRNYSNYPVHNIFMATEQLDNKRIEELYIKNGIRESICNQLDKLSDKLSHDNIEKDVEDYIITTIASLREVVIDHYKNGEKINDEKTPDSEWLYFNIDSEDIKKPIQLFIYIQNICGDIYVQQTDLYIVKRKEKDYFLTMHSKKSTVIRKID